MNFHYSFSLRNLPEHLCLLGFQVGLFRQNYRRICSVWEEVLVWSKEENQSFTGSHMTTLKNMNFHSAHMHLICCFYDCSAMPSSWLLVFTRVKLPWVQKVRLTSHVQDSPALLSKGQNRTIKETFISITYSDLCQKLGSGRAGETGLCCTSALFSPDVWALVLLDNPELLFYFYLLKHRMMSLKAE